MILYRYTFRSYRYIEYRDISMYRHQNIYFYMQLMLKLCIVVVNYSALQLFLAYNLRKLLKISKFTLDYIVQYIAVS